MLSEHTNRYIELHRSLGFKFRSQAYLLRHFSRFAEARNESVVRSATVVAWASEAPSAAQRRLRLLVVRRFAQALQAEDDRNEIPPSSAFGRPAKVRRMPHIYTPSEIRRLLDAAAQLTPKGSLRPATYVALFSLLASTGLRISEALALQLDDLTSDGLIVRHTKFRKNRLVPLHITAREGLDRYITRRMTAGRGDNSLFISMWNTRLAYPTVVATFLGLTRSIGLRGEPGTPGPCLHDFRHTFAVRALEACDGGKEKIARHMLALSTYLGHAHLSDTYYYLQATPKLLQETADAGEALFRGGAS
ncbi:tyrosine-type recombinase/integrase [Pirellulales bacterium]|nr:tyrosine-type recombinase/integrase [Pirellulales bacterium]